MNKLFKNVYTAHEHHKSFPKSNCGEKERPDYKPSYNENGSYELVKCGVFHSYEDVQAWLPTCDMGQIMERYIRTGDSSLLNRRAGFYGDVTDLPTNYAELHNLLHNADAVFDALPVELREAFGHNPAVFYADQEKANKIVSDFILKGQRKPPAPSVEVTPAPSVQKEGVLNE